jgi:hypothetical protein
MPLTGESRPFFFGIDVWSRPAGDTPGPARGFARVGCRHRARPDGITAAAAGFEPAPVKREKIRFNLPCDERQVLTDRLSQQSQLAFFASNFTLVERTYNIGVLLCSYRQIHTWS